MHRYSGHPLHYLELLHLEGVLWQAALPGYLISLFSIRIAILVELVFIK